MSQFEVAVDERACVVHLSGEIDMAVTDELRAAVRDGLDRHDTVELDLAGVTFLDSSGLGSLVLLRNEASDQHKSLSLVNVPPMTHRLLQITGLRNTFDIRDA